MNTAMWELIVDFEAIEKDGYTIEPKAAIELCKQLLKREEDQIKSAYNQGYRDGENSPLTNSIDVSEFSDADIYYRQNHKECTQQ